MAQRLSCVSISPYRRLSQTNCSLLSRSRERSQDSRLRGFIGYFDSGFRACTIVPSAPSPARCQPPRCLPLPEATAASCRRGAASACAAMPRARGGWVPPLRLLACSQHSKETPKTGDHGGKVRQPKRHCLLLTDAGIQHLLEDGYRALRAPASTLMPSAQTWPKQTLLVNAKHSEQQSCARCVKPNKIKDMPLVKSTPRALESGFHPLTNRVKTLFTYMRK